MPAGAYRVVATLFSGETPLDQVERVVGKRGGPDTPVARGAIPPEVPSYQQLLARERPLFHLSPIVEPELLRGEKTRWDYVKPFMDEMTGTYSELEYQAIWRQIEPLPGVYDWEEVDRVMDYAQEKHISVLLWLVISEIPEWAPSLYTRNKEGEIGHTTYLFHGGRLNVINAEPLRQDVYRFFAQAAARYRSRPALQGYFFITEHPGEAPYAGWYEGYEQETVERFRAACRSEWKTVATVNHRWGTSFTAFEQIGPPQPTGSDRYWLDWMQFRTGAVHDFLLQGARTIRRYDPRRLIMVYDDGLLPDRLQDFVKLGCMTANGGSQSPLSQGDGYIRISEAGLQERTEEITPGSWSATFPTQLDASVFSMMLGGGNNAHCKMYIRAASYANSPEKSLAAIRKSPYSLDRYEQFMPIWTELRGTELLPKEAYLYEDFSAYLATQHTTYTGWYSDPWANMALMQAHVPFGVGAAWEQGKLVCLIHRHTDRLEQGALDRLVRYAQQGGTLVMRASSGRRCVDLPGEDWVLLRRFGFTPPAGERVNGYAPAVPVPGEIFPAAAQPFRLGNYWNVPPPQDATTLAYFRGDQQSAALSWRPVGKGKVVVIWADDIWPPSLEGYPFLRDLARWAGVRLEGDSDSPQFCLNLLKQKQGNKLLRPGVLWHFQRAGTDRQRDRAGAL